MKTRILIQTMLMVALITVSGCGTKIDVWEKNDAQTISLEANTTEVEADIVEEVTESEEAVEETSVINQKIELNDGIYSVKFDTDSSMFHVNEAEEGRAILTVTGGTGKLHLIMPSKNVLNLYSGFAADAEGDKDNWIEPTTEEVTYDDGITEEVFAFDVPVLVLDEEFDLALIGKKQVWYDHKVIVSDPIVYEGEQDEETASAETVNVENGTVEVTLEGGTGKVSLTSPTKIEQIEDGYLVTLEWSSKNYDYMIVDDVKYLPAEVSETSIYEIPVKTLEEPLNVIADTVAMSKPHEIEYVITFDINSIK